MRECLALAAEAGRGGEVPVGALVVRDGLVLGRGANAVIAAADPTAHAEIAALRAAAAKTHNYRLPGAALYCTIEPCAMCAGALVHARIATLIYGADEPRAGVARSSDRFFERDALNHRVQVLGGVLAADCAALLRDFFAARRQPPK